METAIAVGDETYTIARAGRDERWRADWWDLVSPRGTKARVIHRTEGWFCSCAAWMYRPQDRPCKHVRGLAGLAPA